jgi:hypothetical protein
VSTSAENRPESFVLLSRKADEYRLKALRKRKRQWLVFVASVLTSILAGVIANALFALAVKLVR